MLQALLRSFFPRRCPCCRGVISPDMLICPECENVFRLILPPFCMKCGRHVSDHEEYCEECASRDHGYTGGIAVFEYDGHMKRSMSDMKFNGWRENCDYFADRAVAVRGGDILKFEPEALVPVPVHKSRLNSRGYNQAAILAEKIGEGLKIPVLKDFLVRDKKTSFQKTLGRESRSENLKTAFSCRIPQYPVSRVMLVDDIYTTGSTMEGCTLALKSAGVAEVGFICIAAGGR